MPHGRGCAYTKECSIQIGLADAGMERIGVRDWMTSSDLVPSQHLLPETGREAVEHGSQPSEWAFDRLFELPGWANGGRRNTGRMVYRRTASSALHADAARGTDQNPCRHGRVSWKRSRCACSNRCIGACPGTCRISCCTPSSDSIPAAGSCADARIGAAQPSGPSRVGDDARRSAKLVAASRQ